MLYIILRNLVMENGLFEFVLFFFLVIYPYGILGKR